MCVRIVISCDPGVTRHGRNVVIYCCFFFFLVYSFLKQYRPRARVFNTKPRFHADAHDNSNAEGETLSGDIISYRPQGLCGIAGAWCSSRNNRPAAFLDGRRRESPYGWLGNTKRTRRNPGLKPGVEIAVSNTICKFCRTTCETCVLRNRNACRDRTRIVMNYFVVRFQYRLLDRKTRWVFSSERL